MMIRAIAFSAPLTLDQAANAASLQDMIDRLDIEAQADGWPGVKVVRFFRTAGRAEIEVEPGVAPLTLDVLRTLKQAGRPADEDQQQERLL